MVRKREKVRQISARYRDLVEGEKLGWEREKFLRERLKGSLGGMFYRVKYSFDLCTVNIQI